jgi:two-component system, NarL family, response regulator NreC
MSPDSPWSGADPHPEPPPPTAPPGHALGVPAQAFFCLTVHRAGAKVPSDSSAPGWRSLRQIEAGDQLPQDRRAESSKRLSNPCRPGGEYDGRFVSVIRTLIVDDHPVVRTGLRLLLDREEDIETVGEAGDAREALRLAERLSPDVVLMDVVMPGASGVDAAAQIRHVRPYTRILMLSMQDDPSYVRQAFTNGAVGYVLKDAASAELVTAIRSVAAGERYVHPSIGAKLAAQDRTAASDEEPLSNREREVLTLLALGHTNQETADRLVVSVRTVEAHRSHILTKLRLSSRAELVRYAIHSGLLEAG